MYALSQERLIHCLNLAYIQCFHDQLRNNVVLVVLEEELLKETKI